MLLSMTLVDPPGEERCINRFRVRRLLGQGAQGVVYLACDPDLDRQVAIKTLSVDEETGPFHAEQLIAAARRASSLGSHPNIVQVFEVGVDAGEPYVVFEYVEGMTLAALLRAEGALPMARAVIMMSQILAGISHVHAGGLLHGDIKPANILISTSGTPRVTDFGISRPALAAAGEPVSSGTVQYMAPESVSEGRSDYRSDVFALGLLFHEILTGKPVYDADNEYQVIYRILNEAVTVPSALNPRIDRRLDEIILKAVARDPAHRYADAGDMKADLDRYRVPNACAELKENQVHSTVEFLLRRMSLKSDFPALSASFNRINQLTAQGDDASLRAIADLVIRDFALTQKLLRVVNAASVGAGKVTKVSQAIAILGMSRLRALAIAMMLASGGRSGPNCPAVAAALTDVYIAGVLAREIGQMLGVKSAEELFICGMFSRLGQLLALYYLKDEHEEIQRRVADEGLDPALASRRVLGLTFDQLGAEVAQHWHFPDAIVRAMHALPEGEVLPATTDLQRMWHCAAFARELCMLARIECAAERELAFSAHLQRFAAAVPADASGVRALIAGSVEAALNHVLASELKLTQTILLDGLRELAHPAPDQAQGLATAADAAALGPRSSAAQAGRSTRARTTIF
jgi:serine/threonine protein kinase